MIATLDNIESLLENDYIWLSPIYVKEPRRRFWFFYILKTAKYWKIQKEMQVQLSTGQTIIIPVGFVTDLSSSPELLWNIAPPYGNFLMGAIIHDFLYVNDVETKGYADREMLRWSQRINANQVDNYVRYAMVRLFGRKWWDRGHAKFLTTLAETTYNLK